MKFSEHWEHRHREENEGSALHVTEGVNGQPSVNPHFRRKKRPALTTAQYVEGILAGDITVLSQAITLVESNLPEHYEQAQEIIERCLPRSGNSVRIGITGVPGAGKSTFINTFAGKACAKTGNKPGVTKGKQWIRLNKNVELLDTPGILWPKFEDQTVGQHLAFIGSIKDELIQSVELALDLIEFLTASYPGILGKTYSVDESEDSIAILNAIAVNCGCLKKGNELDHDKAAFLLLDDFRNARLGKISVENPQDGENNGN